MIVVSILVAFAIDAWWDSAQDRSRIERDLEALRVDLETNSSRLERASERGSRSMDGVRALVAAIGPDTPVLTEDSLRSLFGRTFTHGAEQLELASTDALLASTVFAEAGSAELFRSLTDLRASYTIYRSDGDLFIELREDLISYLITISPGAFVSQGTRAHEPTDFPVDVEALLRDPQLEGLAGNLAVRTRNLNENGDRLASLVDSISARLNAPVR